MRLLIHFARYGPYHHARLRAAHDVLAPLGWEVIGLEIAGSDATYAWDESTAGDDAPRVMTAFPGRVHEEIRAAEYRAVLPALLESLAPDVMAIAGWGSTDAITCLSWCRRNEVRRIVMSETRAADGRRVWWKELVKRYLISRFDGALVGARSHRDYLVKLGMKPERIAFGYNVVDHAYFSAHAEKYRCFGASVAGVSVREIPRYFLASNRFIERKNLLRLIEAYGAYACRSQGSGDRGQGSGGRNAVGALATATSGEAKQAWRDRSDGNQGTEDSAANSKIENHQSSIDNQSSPWPLVLLGDGEQKPALIAKCHELGLQVIESAPWEGMGNAEAGDGEASSSFQLSAFSVSAFTPPTVFLPGFRQIEELPRFYAHAGAFVHPALEEPWGLVLNEAMACGLPVLSSSNVGAAEELVDDGVNGWTFDPGSVEEIAECLRKVAGQTDEERRAMGAASARILEERSPTAAFGRGLAGLVDASAGKTR